MTPERWRRIKQLFHDALEQPADRRVAFLARAAGDDAELRREVERMLSADDATVNPLEEPVAGLTARLLTQSADAQVGRRIGSHKLVREIGRGGMGTVYLAVRDDGQYREEVAIKLIKRGMDTDAIVGRFVRERQILADLDHPNIARLLDGGVTDDGLPYFVMEYIVGQPIDRYCDDLCLSTGERLELFRTVCDAVHAAHRRLIVHCDLKPSNILVTAEGVTKLVDFGVARILDPDRDPLSPVWTAAGRLLTPGYASPEQVRGEALTTASDVYSLGVVLYELLSGRRPYRLGTSTRHELEQAVCEQEPTRPSLAVRRSVPETGAAEEDSTTRGATPEVVSRCRGTVPERLGRRLAGDLDNIVLMALRKEPERRYSSAQQLAEDLRRHLKGLPVLARQPTVGYRTGKFLRRHWLGVAAILLLITSLVVGIVATTWQAQEARRQQRTAEQALDLLTELFDSSDPNEAQYVDLRDVLDEGAAKIGSELADAPLAQAQLRVTVGGVYRSLGEYARAEPHLEQALALRRRELGLHSDVADSLRGLGILRFKQGRHEEAEELLREALDIQARLPREPAAEIASNTNNLGLVLQARGDYAEAEMLLRQALEKRREIFGGVHADVATSLNNLGVFLRQHGSFDEAEVQFREALEIRRQLLGPKHLRIATTLNNLGVLLKNRQRFEAGETVLREALAMQRDLLGDRHQDIAATLSNLASLRYSRGELAEAADLYRQTLAMQRELLGRDHPDTTSTLGNLSVVLHRKGDLEAAESLLRESLEIERQRLGEDHLRVATSRANLARVLRSRGQLETAAVHLQKAISVRQQTLGDQHPSTITAVLSLGALLTEQGELSKAETLLSESMSTLETSRGSPAAIAGARRLLGACLSAQQRYAEAEPLLLASWEYIQQRGTESPRYREVRQLLFTLYRSWGRPEAAQAFVSLE
ncbi:MAG: serine/threonine-protein kinase [Acidobacteriota bacterium]